MCYRSQIKIINKPRGLAYKEANFSHSNFKVGYSYNKIYKFKVKS